ncbi:hypothetical protein A3767_23435 [Oleiphilus sp. HI0133]|nr:hypothetical protein A3767_23435 [Oleiphilus sp. HI0133]
MPPLYKVKKGKQEQYLKDEKSLEAYLTQSALDDTKLFVNESAPALTGEALETLVNSYRLAKDTIGKLSRSYPEKALNALLKVRRLDAASLKDQSQVEEWVSAFSEHLGLDKATGTNYMASVFEDKEHSVFLPKIDVYVHGISTSYILKTEFIEGGSYAAISKTSEALLGLLEESAYVQKGEKKIPVSDFGQMLDLLMKEAQRGLAIQRYKGLGEMNPDQLWETTMDPETRRMMKVTIEDAVAADLIFTTLMGDEVEPRRDFIQSNALEVTNLDV